VGCVAYIVVVELVNKRQKTVKIFAEKKKQNKRFKFSNELVMNFLEKI
jgi:hypothetical protein